MGKLSSKIYALHTQNPTMPKPTPLQQGRTLRNQGMKTVLNHTVNNWKENAWIQIELRALTPGEFNFDDIRGNLTDFPDACHPNAIGAIINKAIKQNLIIPTGNVRQSLRKAGHARVCKLYVGYKFGKKDIKQKPAVPNPITDFSETGRAALEAFYKNRESKKSERKKLLLTYAIKDKLLGEYSLRELEYYTLMQWGFKE